MDRNRKEINSSKTKSIIIITEYVSCINMIFERSFLRNAAQTPDFMEPYKNDQYQIRPCHNNAL